jgi:hypothetical protein
MFKTWDFETWTFKMSTFESWNFFISIKWWSHTCKTSLGNTKTWGVTSKTWWFISEMCFKVSISTIFVFVFTISFGYTLFQMFLWCEFPIFWLAPCLNSLLAGSNLLHLFHGPRCPSQWPQSWMVLARITLLEHLQLWVKLGIKKHVFVIPPHPRQT